MKPFHKLVSPRTDVQSGVMDKSVYAASLGDLLRHSAAGKPYWDKREFDRLTYHTQGLNNALDDIRARLHDGRGNGFRQIETSFGGGKTHSMIAMYHMCRDWDAIPVVIDGTDLDPSTDTIWGEMERQLDGDIDAMSGMVAPGGEAVVKLLERPKPVLILIDEIAHYLDGSKGVSAGASKVNVGESNMAAQTVNFLQKLFSKVGQLPHVCVVISLPDRDQVLEKKYYTQVQRVAGRQRQVVTVATDDDIPHIIRRRLFETDEAVISDRAKNIIQTYVAECVAGHSIPRNEADTYTERFRATYPFTPDVIDVLYGRWGSYPTFQRTRGALRLLSSVVHSLLGSDRPCITLSDIDLRVDEIRKELLQHPGMNMESMVSLDITSKQSGAARLGATAVRAARAIFMYSFPAEHKGATRDDIKRAAFTANANHSTVGDILASMRRSLFFLELADDSMFRFTNNENINRIMDRAKRSVSDADAESMERDILRERAGSKFRHTYVWPDHTSKIEDIPGLQLVLMRSGDIEYCRKVVTNVSTKSGRVHQNALVFILPGSDGVLSDSIRAILAVRSIRRLMGASLKPADAGVLDDAEERAKEGIEVGLREKYAEVWLPDKEDIIRRCGISSIHPKEDKRPFGDVIWEKLVGEFKISERLDPALMAEYDGSPEDIFNRMMRTCGERRPASLDVVRVAVERLAEKPEPPSDGTGDDSDDGPDEDATIVDIHPGTKHPSGDVSKPPKELTLPPITGLHCTDVMDRYKMAGWGSIFVTLRDIPTTTARFMVDQRSENEFSIQLDMTGQIPREVASSIRDIISDGGKYEEDEGW